MHLHAHRHKLHSPTRPPQDPAPPEREGKGAFLLPGLLSSTSWYPACSACHAAGALVQACALEMVPGCSYRRAEAAVEAAGGKASRQEEGMVAWRLHLRTPEAPSGRQVCLQDLARRTASSVPSSKQTKPVHISMDKLKLLEKYKSIMKYMSCHGLCKQAHGPRQPL